MSSFLVGCDITVAEKQAVLLIGPEYDRGMSPIHQAVELISQASCFILQQLPVTEINIVCRLNPPGGRYGGGKICAVWKVLVWCNRLDSQQRVCGGGRYHS